MDTGTVAAVPLEPITVEIAKDDICLLIIRGILGHKPPAGVSATEAVEQLRAEGPESADFVQGVERAAFLVARHVADLFNGAGIDAEMLHAPEQDTLATAAPGGRA